MIIGIDARFALGKRRGIGNYTLNLIQYLAEIDNNNKYILYTDADDLEKILPQNNNFEIKKLIPANYLIWEQLVLPREIRKDNLSILHCTGNTSPIFLDSKIKLIITIHDVMYLNDYSLLPSSSSYYQKLGRKYRKFIVPLAIKNITNILTVSEFSKNDILCKLKNIDHRVIVTTYEAANDKFRVINRNQSNSRLNKLFNFSSNYLLALGGIDSRKNTSFIINSFINLKKYKGIKEKLIIIGLPNWEKTEFYNLVQDSNFERDIHIKDFITLEDLISLYNNATMFLYPSLYEGFGIPPLEAMACGTPVITSNTTSIPEIVGDAALKIDPTNQEEFEAAIYKLLIDHSLRDNLIQRGLARVKHFSWRRMAEETLDIYRSVMTDGNGL